MKALVAVALEVAVIKAFLCDLIIAPKKHLFRPLIPKRNMELCWLIPKYNVISYYM